MYTGCIENKMQSALQQVARRYRPRHHQQLLLITTALRQRQPVCHSRYTYFSTETARKKSFFLGDNDDVDHHDEAAREEQARLKKQEILQALDNKTGRGWTDPWDLEDMLNSKEKFEDLLEWSPQYVSRVSQERVQIHAPDKIPKLRTMAELPLPPAPPPHPAQHAKAYALQRKRAQYKYIAQQVRKLAAPKLPAIQQLSDWDAKQDAVDALFEELEFKLREAEPILKVHPNFGTWVERALEEYLVAVRNNKADALSKEDDDDETAVPVFMDVFSDGDDVHGGHSDADQAKAVVPKILHPLQSNKSGEGNMIEEWELAANKTTKRIMLRQCTRTIARALVQYGDDGDGDDNDDDAPPPRVVVSGRQGTGKTAALAAIVASARTSGHIVLYMPNGSELCQFGFYVEPNEKNEGLFDLPVLSQKACENFLKSHQTDLIEFTVEKDRLDEHFTMEQFKEFTALIKNSDKITVADVLQIGAKTTSCSAPCYTVAIEKMMNQNEKPFLIVMDEFNCYFKPGMYFHADYDEHARKPIPYDQITLFKPALDAVALSIDEDDEVEKKEPVLMKRGGVIVGMTGTHGVAQATTDALVERAREIAKDNSKTAAPMIHCEVPRLSALEVEHMLANYEATGVGKLRLDQGETVMNRQEVSFLRMVSGGVAQKLMNACIL